MNLQKAGYGIEQRQAGIVMVNHPLQCGHDSPKQLWKLQTVDQHIVHFQQNAQPVALPCQLRLVSLRGFQVQRVVHRYRNLAGHPLHELQLTVGNALRRQTPESHRSHAPLRRGQRYHRCAPHTVLPQSRHVFRVARLLFGVRHHERLLRLPHLARRRAFYRRLASRRLFRRHPRLQNVQAHHVARRVMENQRKKIEFDDRMKPLRQIVKKGRQVALLGNRLADFE